MYTHNNIFASADSYTFHSYPSNGYRDCIDAACSNIATYHRCAIAFRLVCHCHNSSYHMHTKPYGLTSFICWDDSCVAADTQSSGSSQSPSADVVRRHHDGWTMSCAVKPLRHPPYGDCTITAPTGDDKRHWVEVGDNTSSIIDIVTGLFDSVYVDISSASNRPIQVYWHGGTPWEPELVQGFSRKYCGHWYDPTMWYRSHSICQFKVSRFGAWAPLGHVKLLVADKLGLMKTLPTEPLKYTIRWQTEFDVSMIIWLGVGLVLWWIAPRIGRSRTVHVSTGTLVGALAGVLIILFVLSRILPANRRSAFLAASFSAVGVSMSWLWDSIRALVEEYIMWVVLVLCIGAFTGFAISYKYKLDNTSQDLVMIVIRLISSLFLFSSTNNGFVSAAIVILLVIREIINKISAYWQPNEEPIPEWHEQRGHSQDGSSSLVYSHDGPQSSWSTPMRTPSNHRMNHNNTNDIRHRSRSRSMSRASVPVTGVRTSSNSSHYRTMPASATPSRFAQYKLMNERLGPEKASRFTVNGVADYISVEDFEQQQRLTTELELLKLREQLRQGGEYVNVLSPYAQRAVSRWVDDNGQHQPSSPSMSDDDGDTQHR